MEATKSTETPKPGRVNKPTSAPAYERDTHLVTCPRWGTQQIVKARVGISTDYIRYLCKNINCSGAFHMFAINPTVRAMMTSKLANPHPEDDGAEDVPLTPKGRRRAPKRKPKAEPVKGKTGKTPPKS